MEADLCFITQYLVQFHVSLLLTSFQYACLSLSHSAIGCGTLKMISQNSNYSLGMQSLDKQFWCFVGTSLIPTHISWEQLLYSYCRCSIFSGFPYRSQFGSCLLPDFCAQLFSRLFCILQAAVKVRISGRFTPSHCRVQQGGAVFIEVSS